MTAVPSWVGDIGYSEPGATDSTARGLTNGSDWVTSTAPPEERNRWVRIWSETNRRSRKSRSRRAMAVGEARNREMESRSPERVGVPAGNVPGMVRVSSGSASQVADEVAVGGGGERGLGEQWSSRPRRRW
jgi:hypothetical protein